MSARDRLAAARAQRAQAHEMTTLSSLPSHGHNSNDLPAFLAEVGSIQDGIKHLNDNVARISALHSQTLNSIEDTANEDTAKLDILVSETRALSQELKDRIQTLATTPAEHDVQTRKNRVAFIRAKFIEAIQNYQRVEQEARSKSRQRVERQFKIVKPDATPQEVAAVVDGGGQQIFAQALTTSTRYGESRAAYREVQERQQDLQRMEQTLAELAQLFSDMGTLVAQQDAVISQVESTAKHVESDTEKALQHTDKAVVHARSYRRGRWICFGIFVIVIVVLAIVLGVVFGRK